MIKNNNYDTKFVEKIKRSAKSKGKAIKTTDLWSESKCLPNEITMQAIKDARDGKTYKAKNLDDLVRYLNS